MKIFATIITLIMVLLLSACASTPKGDQAGGPAVVDANAPQTSSATTQGAGSMTGFQGQAGATLTQNHTYYFEFDKSVVQTADLASIKDQANYLIAHPQAKVQLQGNTDARGSREYNIALGWRRAQAVQQLLAQYGVSPKQMNMVSYGEERPVALGNTEAAYKLNRRVDLVYQGS